MTSSQVKHDAKEQEGNREEQRTFRWTDVVSSRIEIDSYEHNIMIWPYALDIVFSPRQGVSTLVELSCVENLAYGIARKSTKKSAPQIMCTLKNYSDSPSIYIYLFLPGTWHQFNRLGSKPIPNRCAWRDLFKEANPTIWLLQHTCKISTSELENGRQYSREFRLLKREQVGRFSLCFELEAI